MIWCFIWWCVFGFWIAVYCDLTFGLFDVRFSGCLELDCFWFCCLLSWLLGLGVYGCCVVFVGCYNIGLVVALCCGLVSYLAMFLCAFRIASFRVLRWWFWCGCFGCFGWVWCGVGCFRRLVVGDFAVWGLLCLCW